MVVFGGGGVSCSCRESGCGGVRARGSPVAASGSLWEPLQWEPLLGAR